MSVKVLRIIARLNIGGPARNAVLLTEGLQYKGFETVLLCGQVAEKEGDMGYFAVEKDIEPNIIEELGRELSLGNDWHAFWKLYRVICREKPNIIHTHTAKAGTLGRMAGILYNLLHGWRKKKSRCKLVHTFHGHVLHSYFGKFKSHFFIWIEKILALFTDRLVTVSESLKRELVEVFGIAPEEKFSVVELGFELDKLEVLSHREKSDCVNIGIIGRLTPVKNHRMLFRAVKGLRDKTPGLKLNVDVIGDGEMKEDLEKEVKSLGLSDIVAFRGWIKDLSRIYNGLDIVALTSLNEGTPVSIIEAMAAGRAVVATDVGGVRDIVRDGKSGYLVKSHDDKLFAEKLLDLIKNTEKKNRFGEYGRELIKKRARKERLIKDTEKLYRRLLGV